MIEIQPGQRFDFRGMVDLLGWMDAHGWEVMRWHPGGNIRLRRKIGTSNLYQFLDMERVK